jgi:hypothetical protein
VKNVGGKMVFRGDPALKRWVPRAFAQALTPRDIARFVNQACHLTAQNAYSGRILHDEQRVKHEDRVPAVFRDR